MQPHRTRKRFGQHFLHDPAVIERIIRTFAPSNKDHAVEIGPGPAVLTRMLAPALARLDCIEIDRDLIAALHAEFETCPHVHIHEADALKYNFCGLSSHGRKLRIIGNLPYNISTPLMFHLLSQSACISDMLFMLQKEVVQRITAKPGTKAYGRLSVMIQWRCATEALFEIGPGAFKPPPMVDSAMVRLIPYNEPQPAAMNASHFADLVTRAFSARRKTLRRALKAIVPEEAFLISQIDPVRRPDELSVAEYVILSNACLEIP